MVTGNSNTYAYDSVPAAVELENNSNQKKYTVNGTPKGKIVISKLVAALIVLGMLLLLCLAVVATYFLVPQCAEADSPASLVGPTKSAEDLVDERLPKSLKPLHYSIQIMPFLEENNFTTSGSVSIRLECKEPTDVIVFNVNDIEIDKRSLRIYQVDEEGKNKREIVSTDQKHFNASQKYEVYLAEDLKVAKYYEIFMRYTGHLNNLMQGFYRSKYVDNQTNITRWLASTQFAPTDARRAFPCFDEPAMKARFTISIAHADNYTALSNMQIREKVPIVDMKGWHWDHYHETPEMSTYLVAFIVSDLQPFRFNNSGIPFMLWSRRDTLDQTRFAGSIGPSILNFFEDYFKIPFPLPKIDVVAVPDFGYNAMENWGLITFREKALLFDEQHSPVEDKSEIAKIMAHELAHQWFGNLVTPQWWNDLWLKEGFATYLEYLGVNHVQPSWNFSDEFVVSELYRAFNIDSLKSSHPITFDVNNSNQIRQMYSPISYAKGACLNRMLNHILGEEKFKAALVKYLNNYKYSNANADGLFEAFTLETQMDDTLIPNVTIKDIMETWTTQAGFPVVHAERNYEDGTVRVSQERFLIPEPEETADEDTEDEALWWIPISYTTGLDKDFTTTTPKVWLKNEIDYTFHIPAKNTWLLLNLQQTGYYIVNYDMQNWQLLLDKFLALPPIVRTQLITDSMYLAKANHLSYEIPFKMLMKVNRESHLVPLVATFKHVEFLDRVLMQTQIYGDFNTFLSTLFSHIYERVGLDELPNEGYAMQKLRYTTQKWACKVTNSRCVATARHLYRGWMTSEIKTNSISPNVKYAVYCAAIREGGEDEWKFAYKMYLETNVPSEKIVLLRALGCSKEPWLLSKLLDMMLRNDSGIRKQDGDIAFQSVAENVIGHSLAFDFIRVRWDELTDYFGVAFNRLSKMVSSVSKFMTTQFQLEQLEKFKNDNINNLGSTNLAFEQAIEEVKGNIAFMKNSYEDIKNFLVEDDKIYRSNRK